jgi:hypothetical protein
MKRLENRLNFVQVPAFGIASQTGFWIPSLVENIVETGSSLSQAFLHAMHKDAQWQGFVTYQ